MDRRSFLGLSGTGIAGFVLAEHLAIVPAATVVGWRVYLPDGSLALSTVTEDAGLCHTGSKWVTRAVKRKVDFYVHGTVPDDGMWKNATASIEYHPHPRSGRIGCIFIKSPKDGHLPEKIERLN